MMSRRAARCAMSLAAAAVITASCTTAVSGDPRRAPGGPPPGAADIALLDVGNYPVAPRPPLGTATNPTIGARLDAIRMADYVVGPWQVDPGIIGNYQFAMIGTTGFPLPADPTAIKMFGAGAGIAAGRHDYVNGFVSGRTDPGRSILINAVLRMGDPAAAAAAVTDMQQAALAEQVSNGNVTPTTIPGHPDTQASTYTTVDPGTRQAWTALDAYTAHGPYVLMQRAQSSVNPDAAATLAAKTLDLQEPLIDTFAPTDRAALASLPKDPTGLLAKALPATGTLTIVDNTTWGPHGALHRQIYPVDSDKNFTAAGVDAIVSGATTVYRTRDSAAANTLVDAFTKEVSQLGAPTDAVPNLPGSRCLKLTAGGFYCAAAADRIAIEAQANRLRDTQQMTAAQYVLLAAK